MAVASCCYASFEHAHITHTAQHRTSIVDGYCSAGGSRLGYIKKKAAGQNGKGKKRGQTKVMLFFLLLLRGDFHISEKIFLIRRVALGRGGVVVRGSCVLCVLRLVVRERENDARNSCLATARSTRSFGDFKVHPGMGFGPHRSSPTNPGNAGFY